MKQRQIVNRPILVLNKAWTPISIMPVKKAVSKVIADLALILDPENYTLYNFTEWMKIKVDENEEAIRTSKLRIKVPEVIVLSEFDKVPRRDVKLTRRNLLIRDNFTCQYTGVPINIETATIDHIIPRSRGGKTSWDNLVMASSEINSRKADRTPEEAGLKLLKKPEKPKWSPMYSRFARSTNVSYIPQSWKKFINTNDISLIKNFKDD